MYERTIEFQFQGASQNSAGAGHASHVRVPNLARSYMGLSKASASSPHTGHCADDVLVRPFAQVAASEPLILRVLQ